MYYITWCDNEECTNGTVLVTGEVDLCPDCHGTELVPRKLTGLMALCAPEPLFKTRQQAKAWIEENGDTEVRERTIRLNANYAAWSRRK